MKNRLVNSGLQSGTMNVQGWMFPESYKRHNVEIEIFAGIFTGVKICKKATLLGKTRALRQRKHKKRQLKWLTPKIQLLTVAAD